MKIDTEYLNVLSSIHKNKLREDIEASNSQIQKAVDNRHAAYVGFNRYVLTGHGVDLLRTPTPSEGSK